MRIIEHTGDYYCNERYFNYEGKLIVHGNFYIENAASIHELIVNGDCFVKGTLRTEKIEILGNLSANKIYANDLIVKGDSKVMNLGGKCLVFEGNLEVDYANLRFSTLSVGKNLQAKSISGEYLHISIGEQTE